METAVALNAWGGRLRLQCAVVVLESVRRAGGIFAEPSPLAIRFRARFAPHSVPLFSSCFKAKGEVIASPDCCPIPARIHRHRASFAVVTQSLAALGLVLRVFFTRTGIHFA